MPKKHHAGITGIGSAVPEKIMTNHDWSKIVDTTDEWIVSRTGIKERRIADENTAASDLGLKAAKKALADADLKAKQIDLIIVTTTTPDYPLFPSTAALLQEKLGCTKAASFDLSAACSGFCYGLTTAAQFIETGFYQKILLVSVDILSKYVDKTDRNTCVLFGDGAGAVILEAVDPEYGLLGSDLGTDGSGAQYLIVPAGGTRKLLDKTSIGTAQQYIQMNGKEVFKFAVNTMPESVERALEKAGLKDTDIDMFIPHQANVRIIDAAMKRLKLSEEKVYINLDKYGNTSSASIPLALDEVYQAGRLKKGMILAVCGFGAGLTWGANVLRWCKK